MSATPLCPHCGRPFGYRIDGRFYAVASHGHRDARGRVWIYRPDGRAPELRNKGKR